MSRSWLLLSTVTLMGCSTSPCADFLDHFWPARPPASAGIGAFGGVCNPSPAAPNVPGGAVAPPPLGTQGNIPVVGPGTVPGVVAPPPGTVAPTPGTTAPYIPGQSAPPPLSNLPSPDFNGMPTSRPAQPGGTDARPLPAPPASNAPPL